MLALKYHHPFTLSCVILYKENWFWWCPAVKSFQKMSKTCRICFEVRNQDKAKVKLKGV